MFKLEMTEIDKFKFFTIRIKDAKELRMLHPCSTTCYDSDMQNPHKQSYFKCTVT